MCIHYTIEVLTASLYTPNSVVGRYPSMLVINVVAGSAYFDIRVAIRLILELCHNQETAFYELHRRRSWPGEDVSE